MCSYCGENPGTRDHVPSKVLLDEPFSENLPVVPCCNDCNQSFSLDEEYFACLIECVLNGTTDIEKLKREKVKQILKDKEPLRQKIYKSMSEINGQIFFKVEQDRIKNVILKLAKGHAKYENSEPQFEEPTYFSWKPLPSMTKNEIDIFLETDELLKFPEVGSRAMQNFVIDNSNHVFSHWSIVQPNIYSYCVTVNQSGLTVKMIIWNYLAAEVIW